MREDGPADAPAVVLLHGFACSIRWWDRMVAALARDHRVIRFDLLGHGGSEKPKDGYSMENQARWSRPALTASACGARRRRALDGRQRSRPRSPSSDPALVRRRS